MSGINPGDLDREITVLTGVRSQDSGTGEEVIVWDADVPDAVVTVWAQWLPAGTREASNAQRRLESYVEGVFKTYAFSPRPTPDGTRIRFEGREFDLKPIVEIGRCDGYEIPVTARGEGTG